MLTADQAAERLGINPNTLQRWRARGYGPAYQRTPIDGRVRVLYREEDIATWLSPTASADSSELLSTKAAARLIGISHRTLAHWRSVGRGPAFIKFDGSKQAVVRYRESDIAAWQRSRASREKTVQYDRDYYRCLSDKRLIEEGKQNPNTELCIALAERLEDNQHDPFD